MGSELSNGHCQSALGVLFVYETYPIGKMRTTLVCVSRSGPRWRWVSSLEGLSGGPEWAMGRFRSARKAPYNLKWL